MSGLHRRRGEWPRGGALTPWDLNCATVGLVGYGAVGRRLAGFSVRLLIADPAATAAPGAEVVALADALRVGSIRAAAREAIA